MWLTELRIENFRGIRRARIELNSTSLLIGENDVGKTAVLDALASILGPWTQGRPHFVATDIHRPEGCDQPLRPALIELLLAEHDPGEWDQSACVLVREASGGLDSGLRAFALRTRIDPVTLNASFSVHAPAGTEHPAAEALLIAIRALLPLVQIRSARIHGLGAALAPDVPDLAGALVRYWASLNNAEAGDAERELNEGAVLAGQLVQRVLPELKFTPAVACERIAEVIGDIQPAGVPQRELPPSGTAARKVATLLLAAAMLENNVVLGAPGARPLVMIEDPEAHLHPMMLSALWSLLEPIRCQKLLTTQSGELLAAAPLAGLRRLVRNAGELKVFRVRPEHFSSEELRKFSYHLRIRNGAATFARCWLLVEGETEFWVLSELARVLGYDLAQEGVACVEFAQCGAAPLIKMARELGIQWHLLADGDRSGISYGEAARRQLTGEPFTERVTVLREQDIEHCFWSHGFADVYRHAAGISPAAQGTPNKIIEHAIHRLSKPGLAFAIIAAAAERGASSVPAPLVRLIEAAIRLAREAPQRAFARQEPKLTGSRHERATRSRSRTS